MVICVLMLHGYKKLPKTISEFLIKMTEEKEEVETILPYQVNASVCKLILDELLHIT